MKRTVNLNLPYVSRYISGDSLNLKWLKAVTVNDNRSARHLEWHDHNELELIFPLRGHYQYEFKGHKPVSIDSDNFIVIPSGVMHRLDEAIDPPGARIHIYLNDPAHRSSLGGTFTAGSFPVLPCPLRMRLRQFELCRQIRQPHIRRGRGMAGAQLFVTHPHGPPD